MRLSQHWLEDRTATEAAAALRELRQQIYEEARQGLPEEDLDYAMSKRQIPLIPDIEQTLSQMDRVWGRLLLRASVEAQFDSQAACALHSCILYGRIRQMRLDEANSQSLLSNLQLLSCIPTDREDLLCILAPPLNEEPRLQEYGLQDFSSPTCTSIPVGFEVACTLTVAAASPVLHCNANWLAITTVFQTLSTIKLAIDSPLIWTHVKPL
ncbi:hypothetical protein GMRT_15551 [Giardia muris]|uniref:Uncharacterized protein n=1 Tax=Giardia muris TaxID=5742 RepID=A0A4Z1T6U9_GIAMU|nr:hypothetical protein GMRT_15551 [Giardia muris]|eukprot:TNJ28857.1 hypothetical protein GMRT_15551 [Giardia muris]